MKRATLDSLLAARAAKRPMLLARHLASGAEHLYLDGVWQGAGGAPAPSVRAEAARVLREDKGRVLDTAEGAVFLQPFNPPLRCLIVGAVHIAQALVPMAALTGYDVTVIDPRRAFASDARFPDVAVLSEWPDDAFASLKPDARTAVVTLTHDPKIDDPALEAALVSAAFYITALGSKKTHAARLQRLRAAGFDDATLARIHGPAGLAIHAVSPAEIALSIMAQMTQVLRAPQQDNRDALRSDAA